MTYLSGGNLADWLITTYPARKVAILLITVGVDESGTHGGAKAICVAGCYASATKWRAFARAWNPTANKYRTKGGYHASKASSEDNMRLAGLMDDYVDGGVAITIDYAAYRELMDQPLRSQVGSEYTAAVMICLGLIQHRAREEHYDGIRVVVELGHRNESAVRAYLDAMVQAEHPGESIIIKHEWGGKLEPICHPSDLASHVFGAQCDGRERDAALRTLVERTVSQRVATREELESAIPSFRKTIAQYKRLTAHLRRERKTARQ